MAHNDPVARTYFNALAIRGGPYDVSLDLGQRGEGDEQDVLWQLHLVTNWEHLKSVATALAQVVESYEAEMGEVRDVEGAAAAALEARQRREGT